MSICRACLATEVDLYNIHDKGLANAFANLMGIPIPTTDGVPPYICGVCVHLVRKFKEYRDTCHNSMQILQKLQLDDELTTDQIKNIERQEFLNLKPSVTEVYTFDPIHPRLIISQVTRIDVPEIKTTHVKNEFKNYITLKHKPNDDERQEFGIKNERIDLESKDSNTRAKVEIEIDFDKHDDLNESDNEVLINETVNVKQDRKRKMGSQKIKDNVHVKKVKKDKRNIPQFEKECDDKKLRMKKIDKLERLYSKWKVSKTKKDIDLKHSVSGINKMKSLTSLAHHYEDEETSKIPITDDDFDLNIIDKISTEEIEIKSDSDEDNEINNEDVCYDITNDSDDDTYNLKEITENSDTKNTKAAQKKTEFNEKEMVKINEMLRQYNKWKESKGKKDLKEDDSDEYRDNFINIVKNVFNIEYKREKHMHPKLFYESHPGVISTHKTIQRRIDCLEDFAERINVEIKYLSKEEQIRDLMDTKKRFEHRPFQCQICYKGFSIEQTYITHMFSHDPAAGDYKCGICGLRYKTAHLRSTHVGRTHTNRYVCKECGHVTISQNMAKLHFMRHSGAVHFCEFCGKTFKKDSHYHSHVRSVHNKNAVKCSLCSESFTGDAGVRLHMVKKHILAVKCKSCNLYFETKVALSKHLKNSTDGACATGIRACQQCGEEFNTEKDFIEHASVHKDERQYRCHSCNKKYPSARALHQHRLSSHPSSRAHVRARRNDSRGQRAAGENNRPFMCETCGKAFSVRATLRSHVMLHTGERPHKCAFCPKSFRLSATLKLHVLTHTGERPQRCPLCPRAFRQPAHRDRHLRTHTQEKPYACSVCHKAFTQAGNMREHTRTVHEGLPPRRRQRVKNLNMYK